MSIVCTWKSKFSAMMLHRKIDKRLVLPRIEEDPQDGKAEQQENPQSISPEIKRVKFEIKSKLTALQGKLRLSKLLFPLLEELDLSEVEPNIAVSMLHRACKQVEISDETDEVVDSTDLIDAEPILTSKLPRPHIIKKMKCRQEIAIVPKDADVVCIYYPSNLRKTKKWVCGNVITI
ncbi:hypothetical protein ACFL3C_00550 [Patescibacteria group bacterium]